MQVDLTARHFKLSEGLREHALKKIKKLDKYALKIEACHVIFDVQKIEQICEIVLIGKNLRLTATERTTDSYVSFDAAILNLQKQLRRYHDRIKHHHFQKEELSEDT